MENVKKKRFLLFASLMALLGGRIARASQNEQCQELVTMLAEAKKCHLSLPPQHSIIKSLPLFNKMATIRANLMLARQEPVPKIPVRADCSLFTENAIIDGIKVTQLRSVKQPKFGCASFAIRNVGAALALLKAGRSLTAENIEAEFNTISIAHALSAQEKESCATAVPVTAEAVHRCFWANYLQFGGEHQKAMQWYDFLTAFDNHPAYKGYIHLLFDLQKHTEIAQLIPKLDTTFNKDPDIGFLFVQVLENVGKQDEAAVRLFKLNEEFKQNQEIAFHAAQTYLARKEPENALKVIEALLNKSTRKANNFIFYFLAAQICLQLNRKGDALEYAQKSIELHPGFDKGWLMRAMLEEQAGKITEAIEGYSNYLRLAKGGNPEIEQHLLQLMFKQKLAAQKKSTTVAGIEGPCFEQAVALLEQKEYSKALGQVEQCLGKNPSDAAARMLKVQILTAMGQELSAVEQLRSWAIEEQIGRAHV